MLDTVQEAREIRSRTFANAAVVVKRSRLVTRPETSLPVLVVDDDEPTQKLLEAVLRRSGFASEIAGNGREAIAMLRARDYAMVVLDVMMPVVGGHEVIEFLSAEADPVPVVVCSAAGPAALRDIHAPVVKAVVRKPFDVDEFSATIRRFARTRP